MYTAIKRVTLVAAAFLILISVAAVLPAKAATMDELQAQLNVLMAQLQTIQQQQLVSQSQNAGTSIGIANDSAASDCDFNKMNRTIKVGSRGKDVLCLQEYLIEEEYLKVSATGYFGSATRNALARWQASRGISAIGIFGPESRALYVSAVTSGSGWSPTPAPTPVMPPTPAPNLNASALIDQASLTTSSVMPTLSGYAYNVVEPFGISISDSGGKVWGSGNIAVINNRWSTTVNQSLAAGSYKVLVYSNNVLVTTGTLTVTSVTSAAPTLSYITPTTAKAGDTIYVYGNNFGPNTYLVLDSSNVQIWPNGTPQSGSQIITFTVPMTMSTGVHTLQVGEKGSSFPLTNSATLTVSPDAVPAPIIYSVSPSSAAVGASVSIEGANFYANSKVIFDSQGGAITIAPDKIQSNILWFTVPTNLSSGNHALQVSSEKIGNLISNAVSFTATAPIAQPQLIAPLIVRGGSLLDLPAVAGTTAQRIATFSITARSDFKISSITLGKYNTDLNLQNLKVYINGSQFGTTRTTVAASDPSMTFSSVSPLTVGQYTTVNVDIYADVLSTTAPKTYYDAVEFTGWTAAYSYNGAAIGFPYTIVGQDLIVSSGATVSPAATVVMNPAFNNPSYYPGDVSKKIGSFVVSASASQSVGIGSLTLAKNGNTGLLLQNMFVKVNGVQLGQTQAVVQSNQTFSSYSQITVPAGGSVVIDVYSDILTGSSAGTYQAVLTLIGWSAGGTISGSAIPFPGNVSGQIINVIGSTSGGGSGTQTPPTFSMSSAFNNPTYQAGDTNKKIASFEFRAPSNTSMTYGTFGFVKNPTAVHLANLKVMINGTQIGQTKAVVNSNENMNFQSYTVGTVPAYGAIYIDVYADILGTTVGGTTYQSVLSLNYVSANYSSPWGTYSLPSPVVGQDISVSNVPVLSVALDSATPPIKNVVAGSTGQELVRIRFTADNSGDVRILQVHVKDPQGGSVAGRPSFKNVGLYDGATLVSDLRGANGFGSDPTPIYYLSLTGSGITVPKNSTKTLIVKGDVDVDSSTGAVIGSQHAFGIVSNADIITRFGATGSVTANVLGAPFYGNTITVQ